MKFSKKRPQQDSNLRTRLPEWIALHAFDLRKHRFRHALGARMGAAIRPVSALPATTARALNVCAGVLAGHADTGAVPGWPGGSVSGRRAAVRGDGCAWQAVPGSDGLRLPGSGSWSRRLGWGRSAAGG